MLLYTIRRITFQSSPYFLLPLRGVTAPVSGTWVKGHFYHSAMPPPKPPNVLVYTSEEVSCGHPRYNAVKDTLSMCISPDHYTVYMLPEREVNGTPWLQNTQVLIVACQELSYIASQIFMEYYLRGGSLLVLSSKINLPGVLCSEASSELQPATVCYAGLASAAVMEGQVQYSLEDGSNINVNSLATDDEGRTLMYEVRPKRNKGVAILSQVHLELDPVFFSTSEATFTLLKKSNEARISILRHLLSTRLKLNCDAKRSYCLSAGNLFAATKTELHGILSTIQSRMKDNKIEHEGMTFHYSIAPDTESTVATDHFLPIAASPENQMPNSSAFNHKLYFNTLKTISLGRLVLFVENATTTMMAIKALQDAYGSIAVATRQLHGKGRGGNAWLGPAGCAMFTVCVHIPLQSPLGHRSSFMQHLAALAIAKAVCSADGYEMVNIRVKWPNDIYYGSHAKIGGILVTSTMSKDAICCHIGCGINVSNSQPTLCINDIAKVVAEGMQSPQPRPLTPEEVVARTLNELELLIARFQGGEMKGILQDYYRYWLHGGQTVTLQSLGCKAKVKGLDGFGYLIAESMGKEYRLQPDGNSFDLMNNLIIMKT